MRRPSDVPPPRPRPCSAPRAPRLRNGSSSRSSSSSCFLRRSGRLATFYTDYLWFGLGQPVCGVAGDARGEAGLFLVFAAVFFVVLWVNLAVVDRMTPSMLTLGPEDELVRGISTRQPRAFLVRTIVSIVIALIAASSTIGSGRTGCSSSRGEFRRQGSAIPQVTSDGSSSSFRSSSS